MTGRPILLCGAVAIGAMVLCAAGVIGIFGGTLACSRQPATPSPGPVPDATRVERYDREQLSNATTIVVVGAGRGVPTYGQIIAVAAAIEQSSLRNIGRPEHDGPLGLFQQRSNNQWGTPQQLLDPAHAANTFYDKLLGVPNWAQRPLADVAHAVQHSRHRDAYARWEADAAAIVAVTTGAYGRCHAGDGMAAVAQALPANFSLPDDTPPAAAIAIGWALGQLGTPYSFGGDCTDARSGDPAKQCDCSSLIQQAYRAGGLTLPRVTDDQQHIGMPVASLSNARAGDLVFIPGATGTRTDPGHVGLYIGHHLIVHAPHTGDVVKLTNADGWAPRIAKIRRPFG
jgi:cell wall-associated NlpC family hydrolase